MALTTFWFILIAVLWIGYFVLEGFDFGVGILLPFLGRDDADRRAMIDTIGPVWDGNEVWLLTAGGATFAAFPLWYASLFSGFYLALLLILVALIVRGVSFEFRGKVATDRLAARLGPGHLLGLGAARAAVGGGLRQHRPRRADERRARGHRQPADPAEPVRAARRAGHADPVHPARRDLPGPADHRRAARPGPARRRCASRLVTVPVAAGFLRGQPGGARPAGHRPDGRGGGRGAARPPSPRSSAATRAGPSPAPRSPCCWPWPRCSAICGRTCCRPPQPRRTASPFTTRHRRITLSLS